jgi:hypothetical protein
MPLLLFRALDSMATPCSVNAIGGCLRSHFVRIGDAKLAPPTFNLFSCQDNHKVPWKSVNIPADSSLELSCLHSIKLGQVAIKYDFIAADKNKCGWLGKR